MFVPADASKAALRMEARMMRRNEAAYSKAIASQNKTYGDNDEEAYFDMATVDMDAMAMVEGAICSRDPHARRPGAC